MASKDLLAGKVALITGAGRGVGREIALAMAQCGAKVLVNDLGGSAQGGDSDTSPALEVVKEIRKSGGEASANFDSVTSFKAAGVMVEQAQDELGGLDILVNNAGILRDKIFHKMTEDDWDKVVNVHMKGSFNVARHAASVFRKQESGRMIHMTSTSGLIGNYGQASYGAAKLGITALSKCIALDMARYNVTSNCIGPFAWSRLVGTIPINSEADRIRVERMKTMTPDKIAPPVVALASDAAQHITAQIFCVRANEIFVMGQSRPLRGMHKAEGWTPDTVLNHAFPALESSMYPLQRSPEIFNWDPV
ncbi:SDR family NAD(P)-dependent oxidoreductase [Labrenzia sp. PHM005]|uniref:SDR family NAD(P)-dependent oxidoreductase n=1 Tax=Labrenzia sp. PHM005 TaxID=2590016 RepID=UPI0011403464|nr:SDR family NAD(P)-dependent oxidoreductase [Labrenzia sp. PHM005]QDG78869.1 SDR family NAD(P)-dependent oxidoreductase [Labrenzia sp. PHM005]